MAVCLSRLLYTCCTTCHVRNVCDWLKVSPDVNVTSLLKHLSKKYRVTYSRFLLTQSVQSSNWIWQNIYIIYEGCSIYNGTVLITFTIYKIQRNKYNNHFVVNLKTIKQFRQTVMKWQPCCNYHPHTLFNCHYSVFSFVLICTLNKFWEIHSFNIFVIIRTRNGFVLFSL